MADPNADLKNFVRYSDSVEVRQPDEDAVVEKIVASMGRVNRAHFEQYRHAVRDAHAKSHGVLVGTLTVPEGLPEHLRQGLFAAPRTYPIVVRISSAPSELQSDRMPALRGFAFKVLGVEGPQLLPEHREEKTQDFLLVNHPVIPFGDVAAYLKAQQFAERRGDSSEGGLRVARTIARGAHSVMSVVGKRNEAVRAVALLRNSHPLGETFHSMAALRFGEYLAKFSAAPLSPEARRLTGTELDIEDPHAGVRDLVVAFFREHAVEFELRAQLCTDLARMPVEDGSVEWPEHLSPHQPIARISLPRQEAYSPARRVYGDDVLSFNPWHGIEAHRPLGSIMRVRRAAYESSSRFRHEMNMSPRVEPKDISDVPA